MLRPEIEYVNADLRILEHCQRITTDIDYVFMCAANTSGAAVMRKTPMVHVTPNVVMNAQLLDAAYQNGVKKLLFISSGAAYPNTGARPAAENEMFDADPEDVYYAVGWMKRYSEILCQTYAERLTPPMPTVVIRPSNVYGPYDKYDLSTSHVTAALIRKVVERQNPLEVWGTGEDIRDLIYIDDFIEGMIRAFTRPDLHLAINIASGLGYSVKEILQAILEADNYTDADVRFNPSKPSTVPIRLIDADLAKESLGFQAATSLSDGLAKTITWLRSNLSTWTM